MTKRVIISYLVSLFGIIAINSSYALTYNMPAQGNVIGQIQKVKVRPGETLLDVARRYDVGVREMVAHNRGMGIYTRLRGGTVTVPTRFVLPPGPRNGIVLNLSQLRLYYFHPDGQQVSTYPVGVGRQGWSTPRGLTTITAKQTNPTWHPPKSIRREAARRGKQLPLAIGPGPRNPLGHYAMHLGFRGILIHGTIQPGSIGARSSHGCIRMFPHNIQSLFGKVPIGTQVRIIAAP